MKKFLKRFSLTQFMLIFFIPFGAWGLYYNGWLGLLVSIIGYGAGWKICENWSRIKSFQWKRFFRQYARTIVRTIILVPIVVACAYYYGWRGFVGSIAGLFVGEIISRKILKLG